ncbi:carboxypeptidase-like regulatory domain-containing protein [Nannocystis pusilla]|uniref:Carboxypeptidase-like regulatory domain-containing protein n=1 Tax=Nannocystis pusilla TaxID=889268 RepID=A0A9X3EQC7_9BACT|nr:carboxypeptidase-like regulatory domain-containing protein [Nannocystis pusilla]MCY1008258.1 carboxypeptidase-like regulatory domain-containing protein [Nannocystis pusilla]
MFSWLFMLSACDAAGHAPAPSAPPPVAAAAAPEPAPTPAASSISGRLRAHDGSPLRSAAFTLYRNGFMKPVASEALAADGSFRVDVEPGSYVLSVAAVDHAQVVQNLLVNGPVEVEGNLGTYARPQSPEALQVNLQFLGPDHGPLAAESRTLARTPAGTYRLDLASRPKQAVQMRYQLGGGGGRTYNGPLADRYEPDGGGDYWSAVDLAGRDALELDLAALPPAGKPAQLEWRGEPPALRAVRLYRDAWQPRVSALQRSMLREDGNVLDPDATQKASMAALAAEALAEADAAASADERTLLRLAHLDLFVGHDDDADARERADWLLARVDPLDPRLGVFWNIHNLLARVLDTADETFAARAEAWLARSEAHPDPEVALGGLGLLLYRGRDRGLDARVAELYARVREPRFAGTYAAKHLAEQFDPDRTLQRGKPFPDFEFPALAAGAPPVVQADRRGRMYFVDLGDLVRPLRRRNARPPRRLRRHPRPRGRAGRRRPAQARPDRAAADRIRVRLHRSAPRRRPGLPRQALVDAVDARVRRPRRRGRHHGPLRLLGHPHRRPRRRHRHHHRGRRGPPRRTAAAHPRAGARRRDVRRRPRMTSHEA